MQIHPGQDPLVSASDCTLWRCTLCETRWFKRINVSQHLRTGVHHRAVARCKSSSTTTTSSARLEPFPPLPLPLPLTSKLHRICASEALVRTQGLQDSEWAKGIVCLVLMPLRGRADFQDPRLLHPPPGSTGWSIHQPEDAPTFSTPAASIVEASASKQTRGRILSPSPPVGT